MKTVRQQRILELILLPCRQAFHFFQKPFLTEAGLCLLKQLPASHQNHPHKASAPVLLVFKGILRQYGYGNEYTCHKNSFWYGNGSGSST